MLQRRNVRWFYLSWDFKKFLAALNVIFYLNASINGSVADGSAITFDGNIQLSPKTLNNDLYQGVAPTTPLDLIQEAETRPDVDQNYVCRSLILATYNGDGEVTSNAGFEESAIKIQSPYIILDRFTSHQENENQSYFTQELTVPDLLSPSHFSSFRFIPQCQTVLLQSFTSKEASSRFSLIVETILKNKLAKPYRDYFVFFNEKEDLDEFFKSRTSRFIAYKYGVYKDVSSTGPSQSQLSVIDFCGPKSPLISLQLYRKNCKAIVIGKTVTATAVAGDQFVRFENHPDGSLKTGGGIYYLMFKDCSERMNFTLRMYPTSGSGSKSQVQNNGKLKWKWNGAIGELFEERADLAFPVSIIEPRDVLIDYTCLVAWFEKIFWVKAPPLQTTSKAITKPFTLVTWATTIFSMVACVPVFYCFLRKNYSEDLPVSKILNQKSTPGSISTPATRELIETVLDMIIRLLLEQSTALRRCTGSRIRFTIFIWAAFSLIMGTGYRSKLFFFLSFLESDPVPRTHPELAFSNYKLYFRTYGGVAYRYITQSKDPIHKAMLRNNRLKLVTTTVGCIQKVFLEDNAACMDYDFSGDYTIFKNATLYAEADPKGSKLFKRSVDVDGRFMIIWAFKKGSPLKAIFNHAIMWMMASGMYDRWVYEDWTINKIQGIRWLKSQGKKSVMKNKIEQIKKDLEGGPKPLNIQTLIVPFLVLFCLCGIGLVAFVWELSLRFLKEFKWFDCVKVRRQTIGS